MKATRKESGKYLIVAKNSVGEDRAEIDITILGKYFVENFYIICKFNSYNKKIGTMEVFRQILKY